MTSPAIYADNRIPYFYIIHHIPSNKWYAGSKFGVNANPATFMKPNGYFTSSTKVKVLIERDGLASFEIVCILTEFERGTTAYEFESKFLQENKIAQSTMWLNQHNNNTKRIVGFGTEVYKQAMISKYGVPFPAQSQTIKDAAAATCLQKYGETHWRKNKLLQQAFEQSMEEKIGVKNVRSLESTKQAIRHTMLEKYGVENITQSSIFREKFKTTLKERTGYEHNTQDPACIKRRTQRYRDKTGYNSPMENPEISAKQRDTVNSKYGCTNISAIPEVIAKKVAIQKAKRERPMSIVIKQHLTDNKLTPKDVGISMGWLRFNDIKLQEVFDKLVSDGHQLLT